MTTSTLEVGKLFSVVDAGGIEKQLRRLPGVGRVSVNPLSSSATVDYVMTGRSRPGFPINALKSADIPERKQPR